MEWNGLFLGTHRDVYEPSDDSFMLAEVAASRVAALPKCRFLEVGCGTGVVSLAAARAGATVVASDMNPHAVRLAAHNGRQNNLPIEAIATDLLAGIDGAFDLVAFNPPYLPTAADDVVEGPLNLAFDGGIDGNAVVLRFAEQVLALDEPPAEILVIHSSLSDPGPLARALASRYRESVLASRRFFYEELTVRQFRLWR